MSGLQVASIIHTHPGYTTRSPRPNFVTKKRFGEVVLQACMSPTKPRGRACYYKRLLIAVFGGARRVGYVAHPITHSFLLLLVLVLLLTFVLLLAMLS